MRYDEPPDVHGHRYRRSVALLAALLPLCAAAQDGSAVISWSHDGANVESFRVRYGRTPTGLTGEQLVLDSSARQATIDGLADGTWFFAVVAASSTAAFSDPSNVLCVPIPSGTCLSPPGPVRNLVVTPVAPVSMRVTISNIDSSVTEFDLAIAGSGPVVISLAGVGVFDWCDPDGLGGLGGSNVTPTSPALGGNNDTSKSKAVTFTGPIIRTRCDADAPTSAGYTFSGATVTVQGVSKALVQSGSSWSVAF